MEFNEHFLCSFTTECIVCGLALLKTASSLGFVQQFLFISIQLSQTTMNIGLYFVQGGEEPVQTNEKQ